jgi:hypothetical protein
MMQGRKTQCKTLQDRVSGSQPDVCSAGVLRTGPRRDTRNVADVAGTDAIAIFGCGPTGRRYFDRTNEPKIPVMQNCHFSRSEENAAMPGWGFTDDGIVNRTFVTAYLLTGRIDLAERATLEAINAWKPDIESGEALFRHGVTSALKNGGRRDASGLNRTRDDVAHFCLPAELQAVLELRPALRQSFVLRLFVGFSRDECAGLLRSSVDRVERAALTATKILPSVLRINSKGESMENQELDQTRIERLAHEFWVQRGRPIGSPEEDWFRAEQRLRREGPAEEAPVNDPSSLA